MTELEGCIRFWESKLFYMKAYLEPSEQALIERTIHHLKELQKLKGEVTR